MAGGLQPINGNSVEKKTTKRMSTELKPDFHGVVERAEMFYMRIGSFRLRQRWIDREISQSLTATAAFSIAVGGFVVGFLTCKWLEASSYYPVRL